MEITALDGGAKGLEIVAFEGRGAPLPGVKHLLSQLGRFFGPLEGEMRPATDGKRFSSDLSHKA